MAKIYLLALIFFTFSGCGLFSSRVSLGAKGRGAEPSTAEPPIAASPGLPSPTASHPSQPSDFHRCYDILGKEADCSPRDALKCASSDCQASVRAHGTDLFLKACTDAGFQVATLSNCCALEKTACTGKIAFTPPPCTEVALAGVSVKVTDSVSGSQINDAKVVAVNLKTNETSEIQSGAGLYEQTGTFKIEVTKPGYKPHFSQITILSDGCHVVPHSLQIKLIQGENLQQNAACAAIKNDVALSELPWRCTLTFPAKCSPNESGICEGSPRIEEGYSVSGMEAALQELYRKLCNQNVDVSEELLKTVSCKRIYVYH